MTSEFGTTALGIAAAGFQPLAVGLPLRVMSERYDSVRVARSRRRLKWNSSGLVSISRVWAWPLRKVSSAMTFSRNGMFVFTPRMRNSRSARSIRWHAIGKSRPIAVSFTSIES